MKIKQLFTLALAAGISATSVAETAYNLPITNNASLIYNVSGATQTDILVTASETFKVDRKVIFNLTPAPMGTAVAIGDLQAVAYTLENTSNAPIRFAPIATDLVSGETAYSDAVTDNTAGTKVITTYDVYVERNSIADGFAIGTTETKITNAHAELAKDEIVILYVVATPTVGEDSDFFVHNLIVTAQEHSDTGSVISGAVAGTEITASSGPWVKGTVQTVLDSSAGGSTRTKNGAIQVGSATLGMTKTVKVDSDPFGSSVPKAVPGAIVEYTLTVTNTGSVDATDVIITDTLPVANFDLAEATHVEIFSIVDADGPRTPIAGATTADVKVTSTVDDQILVFPAVKVSKNSGTAVITFTAQLK